MVRNTTLPQRTRMQAALELSQMHCYTRPTQIHNRCILGGKGRGVFRDFKLTRVRFIEGVGEDELFFLFQKKKKKKKTC